MSKAYLILEDGAVFEGVSFGAKGEVVNEVVFNTSMTGYQEILTDPSYYGQMVAMTYPLIGNYGINEQDFESVKPQVSAFIVKEYSRTFSNFRANMSLHEFMEKHGIVGITGVDTRKLVRHIREKGSMNAIISSVTDDITYLENKVAASDTIEGKDLVQYVTCSEPYVWNQGTWNIDNNNFNYPATHDLHIVAVDYGIKQNILRYFVENGARVTVAPAQTTFSDIEKMKPDGVFLSNGPGDPEPLTYAHELARNLVNNNYPVFGICLGNQILSIALGGKTYKLKFGHHGGNQPVKDFTTGKVEITSQNHCFAASMESLKDKVEITHINLNDNTVEGIKVKDKPVFAVQYHPENGPGPHDSAYLFDRFLKMVKKQ
jgi:carbamoyl-phosphate synthase small subunit